MRTLASFHDLASLLAGDHEVMVLRRVERRRVREPLTTEDLLGNTVESLRLVFDTCALYVVCVGESDEIAISAEPDA